jgi:hypothetical protein
MLWYMTECGALKVNWHFGGFTKQESSVESIWQAEPTTEYANDVMFQQSLQ